eukprot:g7792.t1
MKAYNQDQPYIHVRNRESHWEFTLLYANFDRFLGLVTEQMAMKDNEEGLLKRSRERVQNFSFDSSRLVNFSESIVHEIAVTHLMPLVHEQGKLVITNARLYFQPMICVNEGFNLVSSHPLDAIAAVSRRRCSLKPCGLEVFFMESENQQSSHHTPYWDSPSAFFEFQSVETREKVLNCLLEQIRPGHVAGGILESEGQWLSRISTSWQYGQISNFDYLLYLNLASGRSFNDLRQWPVFPWILSNYNSQNLDLDDPENYRDLTKPIGALNPDRLEMFTTRYHEMPRGHGCPPPFFYGTHYSTPGYVMFWLVRAAPGHLLQLQSGKFDSPDRMFYSINEAWGSVNNNPADVKELIPEFYLPNTDFLVNKSQLALGKRQNGKSINDVELPLWAESPLDFLAKNRAALESEFVSRNLHNWINLIFGSHQKGETAITAKNVFYYLSYEGAVDIEQVEDPIERKGLEAQINEFGQTPKQLFKHPHPPRLVIPPTPDPSEVFSASEEPGKDSRNQALQPVVASRHASNKAMSLALISITSQITTTFQEDLDGITHPTLRKSSSVHEGRSIKGVISSSSLGMSSRVDSSNNMQREWSFSESSKGSVRRHTSAAELRKSVSNTVRGLNTKLTSFVDHFNSKLMINAKPPPPPLPITRTPVSTTSWCHYIPQRLQLKHSLSFLQGAVRSVEISPLDGGTLYCAGDNATLRMFSLDSGQQLRSTRIERNSGGGIPLSDLDLLPHMKPNFQPLALIGSYDNSVYVYSIEFGRVVGFFDAHEDAVSVVKLMRSRDRYDRLMTASWDCSLKIWPLSEGRAPWEGLSKTPPVPELHFTEHEASICSATLSSETNLVISGTEEGVVSLFDIRSSSIIWKTRYSSSSVGGLCVLPDAEHLVVAYGDGLLKLVSMRKQGEVLVSVQQSAGLCGCHSDGLMSLHGTENGQISLWNLGQYLGKASTVSDQPVSDMDGFFPSLNCSSEARVNAIAIKTVSSFEGNESLWVVSGQEDGNITVFSSS